MREVHTYLGVLLLSLPSCSAADAIGDPTLSNNALLALDIPLVEVWASELHSFWLLSLLSFGLANMFFCHWWAKNLYRHCWSGWFGCCLAGLATGLRWEC
jgi:hypothetical protein